MEQQLAGVLAGRYLFACTSTLWQCHMHVHAIAPTHIRMPPICILQVHVQEGMANHISNFGIEVPREKDVGRLYVKVDNVADVQRVDASRYI